MHRQAADESVESRIDLGIGYRAVEVTAHLVTEFLRRDFSALQAPESARLHIQPYHLFGITHAQARERTHTSITVGSYYHATEVEKQIFDFSHIMMFVSLDSFTQALSLRNFFLEKTHGILTQFLEHLTALDGGRDLDLVLKPLENEAGVLGVERTHN